MKKIYISVLIIIPLILVISLRIMSFGKLEKSYSITESKEYNSIDRIEYFGSGGYILVNNDDMGYSIVKNGIETKKYQDISNIKYSADRDGFSFIAKKDGKDVFIKDGVVSQPYDTIYDYYNSSDGKKYIFSAIKDGKKIIVKNGFESEPYDMIYDFGISEYTRDYTFYTYIARKDKTYLLIKDGVEKKIFEEKNDKYIYFGDRGKLEYDYIDSIKFLQGGKSIVFVAKRGLKYIVVKDGFEIGSYDNIIYNMNNNVLSNLDISPDRNSFTFIAQKDKKQVLVKDGIESEEYDKINNLIVRSGINSPVKTVNHTCYGYSDDSKSYIFQAETDGKWGFIKDGVESEKYGKIGDVNCYPSTHNYTYIAEKNGKSILFNNGFEKNKSLKKNISYLDGEDYVYDDGFYSYIVIDGVKSKKYPKVKGFRYTSDGNGFSFVTGTRKGEKVVTYTKN